MLEKYLQITCDGCGETETTDGIQNTANGFRQKMFKYGWRNYEKLDYCNNCVVTGIAKKRNSVFGDYIEGRM